VVMKSVKEQAKFPLGYQVMTEGVVDRCQSDPSFASFIARSAYRHSQCDWGDLCEEDKAANNTGWMFGGNFIYSCDSRFPCSHPIPIYDRQETPGNYAHLTV